MYNINGILGLVQLQNPLVHADTLAVVVVVACKQTFLEVVSVCLVRVCVFAASCVISTKTYNCVPS